LTNRDFSAEARPSPLSVPVVAAINHLLVRQPALQASLAVHAGKTAVIEAGLITLRLQVARDGGLHTAAADIPANVTIRVKTADMAPMLANMARAFSYVSVDGDADFAKAISVLAADLKWDAEEDLAPFVGDIAAVRLVQSARTAAGLLQSGAKNMAENVAEYLLEENPVLMPKQAGPQFATDIARLRDDTERLAKRIQLLERAGEKP